MVVLQASIILYMKKLQLNDKRLTRPKGHQSSVNSKPVGFFSK
jgi:hypothetical protein